MIADPHPTTWASLAVQAGRKDNMYLLPVATQFECTGSRIATNCAMQWGEQIVKPIFEIERRPRDHVPAGEEARLR